MSIHANMFDKLVSPSKWTEENESDIMAPYTYLTSNPGKEVVRHMANALNDWFHVPPEQLALIIKISSMLQNDCLLFDDIEDGSELRRGQPVAHHVYGVPHTVNSASYIVIKVYSDALALKGLMQASRGSTDVPILPEQIITEGLLDAHRGQALDISWRDKIQCPTEDQYIDMVKNKTGGLFRILMRLMMACATKRQDEDCVPFINIIGVLYQIRDDYKNLLDATYTSTKGFAEDLTEGKFSFPIVHAIHADEFNTEVIDIIRQRPKTPTLKKTAITHMRDRSKSLEYTLEVLRTIQKLAEAEVQSLGGNPRLKKILEMFRV
ncbi:isoprenoid synthase domain-containing protein [Collybia nuda]|uniref:(2E,6E)-farnesyl diphosphate synthase n=1 Tax=Collybia nuda TaxID=64659 RepID=A0A9P5YIG4_9AGAR|nr:isoprenoid synthase domain-containing protein [Collybia nuda]